MNRFTLLAVIAALLLSGCSAGKVEKPVEIQLMHSWGSSKPVYTVMRDIYEGFRISRPDLHINIVSAPDYDIIIARASDMLAVHTLPDIIMTNGSAFLVHQAVRMGEALDLAPYIKADEEFKHNIDPLVFSIWEQADGGLYTVTDALEVQGYWYNEDIWLAAGVIETPRTWEKFWDMCEKVQDWAERKHNGVSVFALEKEQVVNGFLLARLSADEAGRTVASGIPDTFDTPQVRAMLMDVRRAWVYSRPVRQLEDTRQAFRDGSVAVYCNGLWECPEISSGNAAPAIRYANYPTDSGESLVYLSPASGYLLYDSGDPAREQASVDFLKYVLDTPQQIRIAAETGQIPCNPNVDIELLREKQPLMYAALKEARSADIYIINIEIRWDGYIIEFLKENIEAFAMGLMKSTEIINGLNDARLE